MKKYIILLLITSSSLYAPHVFTPAIKNDDLVNIGISQKNLKQVADKLQILLANEYVLYTKTLKYHWNVVGKFFGPLHCLFGEQYKQLLVIIDDTAERIRAIGYKPHGTLKEFLATTTLKEEVGENPNDQKMIKNLLNDHETIIKQIRSDVPFSTTMDDIGTNNFLSDLIEKHEKIAWMLRAHLQ